MRRLLLLALLPVMADASQIPPHQTVVASCGQPTAVYISTGTHNQKVIDPTTVHELARNISPAHWVDAGCTR